MRLPLLVLSLSCLLIACASGSEGTPEPGFTGDEEGGAAGSEDVGGQTGAGKAGTTSSAGKGGSDAGGSNAGGSNTAGSNAAGATTAGTNSGGSAAGTSSGGSSQGGKAGASGGQGGASGAGAGGKAGSSGGEVCDDKGPEPNNSEALASSACGTGACEIEAKDTAGSIGFGGELAALFGTVDGKDVDFFKFRGKDTFSGQSDPTAKTLDTGIRLCIFTQCDTETNDFKCTSMNAQFEKTANGLQGCCVEGPGEVSSDHDCAGSATDDDSADVFIRVEAIDNVCTNYSVDFHF